MSRGFCSKYAFQQCNYFENRLRFDKATESLKVGTFFETQCRMGLIHFLVRWHKRLMNRALVLLGSVLFMCV